MDPMIATQKAKVQEHFQLENDPNWNAVQETFTRSGKAFFELVPFDAKMDGIPGIQTAYHLLSTALPDVHFDIVHEYDVPGCSIREIILSGTHRGEWCGIAPGNRRVRVQAAGFFIFDSAGDLVAERVYFNNETLVNQMRGE